MVIISNEGKFSDNYYLIDGMPMGVPKLLSIYVIENDGKRLMIDAGDSIKARANVKKLKEMGLYPIHKIFLTHTHWDHAQGLSKLLKQMKDLDVEVLASENAIENLKNPAKINEGLGDHDAFPYDGDVTTLKEGDIIELSGLELEVMTFFGHTMDSIGLFDKTNRNIFIGDAVSMRLDQDTFYSPLMPADFHEKELLKSFQKLRNLKDDLSSISLSHFGVWKDNHFELIIDEMEDVYFKLKSYLIEEYEENPSIDVITKNYCKTMIPNSKHWNETIFEFIIDDLINGLKLSGFIEE